MGACLVANKDDARLLVVQVNTDSSRMPMIASTTPRTSSSTTARSSSTRTGPTMPTTTMGQLRVFFRNVSLTQNASITDAFCHRHYHFFTDLIQPPNIRPISSISDCNARYLLLSSALTSLSNLIKTRSRLSSVLASSSKASLSLLLPALALNKLDNTANKQSSARLYNVYLSCFGISF